MRFLEFLRPNRQRAPSPLPANAHRVHAQQLLEAGNLLEDAGQLDRAQQQYLAALEVAPDLPLAHLNLGNVLLAQRKLKEAGDAYSAALRYKPDYASAHFNLGNVNIALQHYVTAIRCYEAALHIRPDFVDALVSLGYAQHELQRYSDAIQSYDRALALKPDYAEVYNNRGLTYFWLAQYPAAVESFNQAISLRPNHAEAYYNRGLAFIHLDQRPAAIEDFDQVLALDPDYGFIHGIRLHAKMHICDWRAHEQEVQYLLDRIDQGLRSTSTFSLLGLTASSRLQQKAAELWTRFKYPRTPALGPLPQRTRTRKIRIGYFSMDFRNHPVAFLTAGLFETHNREDFEIIAFSFGPDIRDEMRNRLEPAFDRFIQVASRTDVEVAQLARDIGLDIAVDLAGHTTEARTGVFAMRAAPIQVNYLGYPGTLGADYIDYIIVDQTLVPSEHRGFYTERLAYLPCFQVNDAKRSPVQRKFTRKELGLPEDGFVFCCFNNTFKITPPVFDSWMRILSQVEGSVLFLYAGNAITIDNLKREATLRGIDPDRLIFGERLSIPDYMSRYCEADLFLDTLPFNAGTTASDALWAGLPVLTCTGEAFASRMAASLLSALDLPELITSSAETYEKQAIALATQPDMLTDIRQRLLARRATSVLFDTGYFTRKLEEAYRQMVDHHWAGRSPTDIVVPR